MSTARTRFAPSPTGFMHVGGARTALFAWLLAKQKGGQFILRIEDTDRSREVQGSVQHIIESLSWLGLIWDEGPDKGGPNGPYLQSERLAIYHEWALKLIEKGRAYADPYSPEELHQFRERAKAQSKPFLFRDWRPTEPPKWNGKLPLRFKSNPREFSWHDEVMGELHAGPEACDDFILIKSDGYPTYNFAHIIDDHLMNITHVIRSQEFIASVPKYLDLYEALDLKPPIFATLPFVMGAGGKRKLSKRDGAKDIMEYARLGYLPAAMMNFLASLGWNDGTEQELFTIEELQQKFSLARVQKSGAVFDEARLLWMDGAHMRRLSLEELSQLAAQFWPPEANNASKDYKDAVLSLVHERLKYLAELPDLTKFFFTDPELMTESFANASSDSMDIVELLHDTAVDLQNSEFDEADLEQRLRALAQAKNIKPSTLFQTIRISITGSKVAPGLFETLHALGKETSLRRLEQAIQVLRSAINKV